MNKIEKNILLSLPIILISGLIILIFMNDFRYVDNAIIEYVTSNISHSMIEFMKIITNLCSFIVFMLIIILIVLIGKNKKIGTFFILNIVLCYGINAIIKNIVARTRPVNYMIITENGYSFPSAHSMLAVAFYGYLAYLVIKFVKNKWIKFGLVALICAVTIIVGVSRICLGVHFPTDVLSGFLIGYIYILIFIHNIKKYIE